MHNDFVTLEKKCKRYRMKRSMLFLTPALLLLMSGGFYYAITFSSETEKQITPKRVVVQNILSVSKKVSPVKTPSKETLPSKKVVLPAKEKTVKKESVQVAQKFKDVQYVIQVDNNAVLEKKQRKRVKKKIKTEPKKETPQKKEITQKKIKKSTFEVTVKKYDDIKQMEALYKKEKKYSLALKIGEQYFKKKNYSQALKWSKEANILDRKDEGAWLLYAKSEYAKGNKERAIKLLSLYLGKTQSLEAESFLNRWTKEK